MTDVTRQTYMRLMAEIEDLEEQVSVLEALCAEAARGPDCESAEEQIARVQEQLVEKRRELARISDGCGRPHHH